MAKRAGGTLAAAPAKKAKTAPPRAHCSRQSGRIRGIPAANPDGFGATPVVLPAVPEESEEPEESEQPTADDEAEEPASLPSCGGPGDQSSILPDLNEEESNTPPTSPPAVASPRRMRPRPSRGSHSPSRALFNGRGKDRRRTDHDVRRSEDDIYDFYTHMTKDQVAPLIAIPDRTVINQNLEIRNTPDRGRIIVTRRPIVAGTLLLQEAALLQDIKPLKECKSADPMAEYRRALRKQIFALSDEKLAKLLALCHKPGQDTEESRVECNAFNIHGSENIWAYISFLNHSCVPNAHVEQYSAEVGYNLRACVDLPRPGTEVNINYKPDWNITSRRRSRRPAQKSAERWTQIQDQWGFRCQCSACRDPVGTDRDYARMLFLEGRLADPEYVNDRADEDDRDYFYEKTSAYLHLLKKYNLYPTLYRVAKSAAEWLAHAPQDDDNVKLWKGRFLREALDAGIAVHGFETIGDEDQVFKRGGTNEARDVLAIAKEIPQGMEVQFDESVAPPRAR